MSGQNGQIVGYVRVSAADQNEARQVEVLSDVGRVFSEKSPDRLARSTRDLLDLIEQFQAKGVAVEFVDNPALNTDTPQGEFMLTILAAVAQLERATIRERQAEGIAIAKRNGVYERALKLTPEQIAHARERIEADVPKAKIARDLGVSRQTLYAALRGTGKYAKVKA